MFAGGLWPGAAFLNNLPTFTFLPPRALSSFPSDNGDEQDSIGYGNSLQINLSDESFACLAFCGLR